MAGNVKLETSSGGSVTINAENTASDFSLTVPAEAGFLLSASSETGALQLPTGTTAQRPGAPVIGQLRYNSTTGGAEVYSNIGWTALSSSSVAVTYLILGGGGGGAGRSYFTGGSGGGIASGSVALTKGQVYTVTLGAGGNGGPSLGAGDTDGNTSSFGAISAVGGIRGSLGTAPPTNQTNGIDSSLSGTALGYGGRGGYGGWYGQYAGGASFRRSGIGGLGPGNPTPSGFGATANSGSGGGGGGVGENSTNGSGGSGGSGVVILQIPVQAYTGTFSGATAVLVGTNIALTFTSSGSYTA